MRTGLKVAHVIAIALVLLTARAEAGWRLDVQAGAFVPTSDVDLRSSRVDVDADLGAGLSLVVGGGYELGDWVELTAQFQTAGTTELFAEDSAGLLSFTPGARVFFLPRERRIRPWIGSQIGWYRVRGEFNDEFLFDDPDDDVSRTDDSFGINAGGGFDVRVTRRVSLGLDIRYHNAFDALDGFEFVTTNFNVGIHFGD
jgi:opacity protein-like surface antigen